MFLFDTSWLGSLRFAFRLNWKADGRTVPLKSGHLRDWFGHDLGKSLEGKFFRGHPVMRGS